MSAQMYVFSESQRKQLMLNPRLGAGNYLRLARPLYDESCEPSVFTNTETTLCKGESVKELTVHDLYKITGRVAVWYKRQGVECCDTVGVYCDDGLNYIIHFTALTSIGAVPVLTNGMMPPHIAAAHFKNVKAKMVVSDGARIKHLVPLLKNDIKVVNLAKQKFPDEALSDEEYFEHVGNSPIMITHSSGTTGVPKAVVLHHEQWFFGIRDLLKKPHAQGIERYLNALPSSHNSSIAFVIHCILSGSSVLIPSSRDGQTVSNLIESYQPSTVSAFPSTYVDLALNFCDKKEFSSVNTWINSGDAAHERHVRELVKHGHHYRGNTEIKGSQFVDGLGSSEMGHISFRVIHTPYTTNYRRCVGFPQEWVDFKIFGKDGKELAHGETGMLGIKSPSITPGYWNNSNLTYKSRIKGYWLTGDMVYTDRNGRVYHVDRITDVIETKDGPCYSLLTEESVLANNSYLEECTVVGCLDEKSRDLSIPVAYVVPESGCELPEESILAEINEKLVKDGLMEMGHLFRVNHDDIPKGITGKVLKRELRDRFAETAKTDSAAKATADPR